MPRPVKLMHPIVHRLFRWHLAVFLAGLYVGTSAGASSAEADAPAIDDEADEKAKREPPPSAPAGAGLPGDAGEGPSQLALPGGIRLGGMFDAVYERNERSDSLTSGRNAFRNYHHFLFVSRQGADIPVGFNAEVLGLYFYELTALLTARGAPLRLSAHAGKIMVPFGPDPLFHKNYGGLSGVDQRLLPIVWSSMGAGMRLGYSLGHWSLTDEIYAVQGFDLPSRDQQLNLQRDLIAYDGARIAVGNRLGLATGPFTLWYSAYWNPLRFGRRLLMQALDFAIWRPDLPVLRRVAVGVGAMRAHVSQDSEYGQPGAADNAWSYYDFGDYLWLRFYLSPWLYVQARGGLSTFNNNSGLTYDSSRADVTDGSHYNLMAVAEYAGAQVSLAYYWNNEKVDERPDDLLRLMLTYAF
jgi:hypothetical protein